MVKARPILMSGPMVRACLNGTKTQTRRVAGFKFLLGQNPKFTGYTPVHEGGNVWRLYGGIGPATEPLRCPYGQPGDLLWVREAWAHDEEAAWEAAGRGAYYRADPNAEEVRADNLSCGIPHQWRPSIHMPRWASRLTLRVTNVRVERLQDISEADAEAEGIEDRRSSGLCPLWRLYGEPPADELTITLTHGRGNVTVDLRVSFQTLWDSINAKRAPWDSNPWVWCLSFETVLANVDSVLEVAA